MVLRMRSAGLKADSRRFWIGVAVMAAFHAALIAGFVRSAPRYVGELEGDQSGISVELVDAADLQSRSTVLPPEPSVGGPGGAAAAFGSGCGAASRGVGGGGGGALPGCPIDGSAERTVDALARSAASTSSTLMPSWLPSSSPT